MSLAAIQGKNRKTPRAFSRACGVAAASAGALFLAWGYLHAGGDPYAYGDPHQPYLDSAVAALALSVPALFFVGLAGLFARGVVGRVGLSVGLVAAVGFVLAFAGATVGVVRGIEGGLGWYGAYVAGRQNTTAFGLLLPAAWIEWTTLLFAGLTVVGLAALGDARVGPLARSAAGDGGIGLGLQSHRFGWGRMGLFGPPGLREAVWAGLGGPGRCALVARTTVGPTAV